MGQDPYGAIVTPAHASRTHRASRADRFDAPRGTDGRSVAPCPTSRSTPRSSPIPRRRPRPAATGYTAAGVPTLDHVRDKIEGRYATALGMDELVGETEQARSLAEQEAARKKAAEEKLAEIRRSLGRER